MDVRSCQVDQLAAITLTEGDVSVVVVPDVGGKLCSITWKRREILARNPLRPPRYAASYADFDASGFDECLPSIGACAYPLEPWLGTAIPDHGEVWSIPWSWTLDGERLHLTVHGVRFPYTFEKSIELRPPGSVRLRYTLTNRGPFNFNYLWSAHPLLAPLPGMRIHLPEETRVRVDWSKDGRLGDLLGEHSWPLTHDKHGRPIDLGLIPGLETGYVDKLYTTRLRDGWCAVHDPADGFYVAFLFPSDRVPYVGLSINSGGWPLDRPAYYNLGLEPCSGYPDRLDLAITRGDCAEAAPGERHEWHVDLHVGRCPDLPALIPRLREGRDAA